MISLDGYNIIRADHPSDFKRGGVCIYYKEHILLIKRDEIQTAFDKNPTVEVRGVFLDISKAFDKRWHSGHVFKLKT